MEARQVWHVSFMSTWMFVFFFLAVCSGMDSPKLRMNSTVFVAFAGDDLDLSCMLMMPTNQSGGNLTCYDPLHKEVYSCPVSETGEEPQNIDLKLELKNVTSSGEYSCQFRTAKVYWYLRVRRHRDLEMPYNIEVIAVAVVTGVLVVFSVVGSVYVFRGHGIDCLTECGDRDRSRKQNREEKREGEMEEDNVDVITAPSPSFYASLQTRPRSIYDVLDHSAASREPDRSKAKPKAPKGPKGPKGPKETVAQTTQDQHEGVFECVYENF